MSWPLSGSFRVRSAVLAQLLGVVFLLLSLSVFLRSTEAFGEQGGSAYLLQIGLWLLYGFLAMSVSWLLTLSLANSAHRQQMQSLCVSGIAISSALLTLSCAN